MLHSLTFLPSLITSAPLLLSTKGGKFQHPGLYPLSCQSVMSFIYGVGLFFFHHFSTFMLPWLSLLSLSLTIPCIANINTSLSRECCYICLWLYMLVLLTGSALFLKSLAFFILILKQTRGVSSCSKMMWFFFFLPLNFLFVSLLILHWFIEWRVYFH